MAHYAIDMLWYTVLKYCLLGSHLPCFIQDFTPHGLKALH